MTAHKNHMKYKFDENMKIHYSNHFFKKHKGVQEEIPSEEASTLQIGSVAFAPGQCTSPQLHPCHRLFEQDGHQDCSSASL